MGASHSSLGLENFSVDKSKSQVHEDWTLSSGKLNGNLVTVFSAIHPYSSRKRPYMEKALQCSKIYRHPGILKYLEGGLFGNEIVVVTEQATPLLEYGLELMSPLEITIGLSSITEALVFLHDKAGVSHNNICPASIFITSEGTWKLWGFEYLCSFGELTRDHIERINQYCYEKAIPPDDKSHISPAYQHARDCFALGKFMEDFIGPLMPSDAPQFGDLMSQIRSKALNEDWTQRPRLSVLGQDPFFSHEFLKLHGDITNILLLPSDKKDDFIKSLSLSLRAYPEELVASTLGPLLLSRQVLLIPSSATHLLPLLLAPKERNPLGIFSTSVFKEHLIPSCLKLFNIHDATIRRILLSSFEEFASLIPEDILKNTILPELLLGIRDTDEMLIVSTLKALAHLVPILGANTVIGSNRQQIFATAKPKNGSNLSFELKNNKKKGKLLPIQTPPHVSGSAWNKDENCTAPAPHTLAPDGISVEIPERSSPDGGETSDDELFDQSKHSEALKKMSDRFAGEENESWSEWEEMIDKPTPDIVGILEVMAPESESIDPEFGQETLAKDSEAHSQTSSERRSFSHSSSSSSLYQGGKVDNSNSRGSGMKLKSKAKGKEVNVNLGREFNIKAIKIKKKPDSDLDLFADLIPNLNTKAFDLETMLMEASNKVTRREKIPSVSDTLAELELQETREGDGWQEEPLSFDNATPEDESCLVELRTSLKTSDSAKEMDNGSKLLVQNADEIGYPKKTIVNNQNVWDDWDD